jgi:hypothetical protein
MKPTSSPHGFDDGVPPTDSEFLHNVEVAHEHGDVNVRAIVGFLAGLATLTAAVIALMWLLFMGLERQAASSDPQLSPVSVPAGQLPPQPRLLTDEPQQLKATRDAEAAVLAGGRDEKTGTTRLSIDEAKQQLVGQGLPTRAGAPPDGRLGTSAPAYGEASGGRALGSGGTTTPPAAARPQPGAAATPAPPHKGH